MTRTKTIKLLLVVCLCVTGLANLPETKAQTADFDGCWGTASQNDTCGGNGGYVVGCTKQIDVFCRGGIRNET